MSDMTMMDLVALKNYAGELESFKSNITAHCNNMESGISSCGSYMLDETSKAVLQKGTQMVEEIRTCIAPVERELERVYQMISVMEAAQEYS